MHFNDDAESNQSSQNNRTINSGASKNCSTSSSDSGVIFIDNAATFNNRNSARATTKDKGYHSGAGETKDFATATTEAHRISIEHTLNIHKADASKGPKKASPTVSVRSTTISIVSIDENAIDSSCIDSDSDGEADVEGVHDGYTVQKLGQPKSYPPQSADLAQINKGLTVISQQIRPNDLPPAVGAGAVAEQLLNGQLAAATPTTPAIGSIALTNSTDVTIGDKHFYEGPVTIQQFLIDNREKWKTVDAEGRENPGFNGAASNGAAAGAKSNSSSNGQTLCSFLPHTISRKALIITVTFVVFTTALGIILAQTTNVFGTTANKSKIAEAEDSRQNIPINSTIEQDNIGGGKVLRIVPRAAWLAQPAQNPLQDLTLPVSLLIALPTNTERCTTQAECTFRVRFRQTYDIESLRYDDIAYNFLVGGDGNVYEGRGWNLVGAHMKGYNDRSLSFAYIGSFQKTPPSPKQLNVTQLLIDEGVRLGKIVANNYKLMGASTLDPTVTEYKAQQLYASLSKLPNWSLLV